MTHLPYPKTPRYAQCVGTPEMKAWNKLKVVIEEKVDGANAAVHFVDGRLTLQSRGHVLTGGARERIFERFKPWAYEREPELRRILGERYVAYGEWCYAKNRIFYDALPDYFIEFDVFDKEQGRFLTTPARQALLQGGPLTSVAILHQGACHKAPAFTSFTDVSRYKTGRWRDKYKAAMKGELGRHYADSETDASLLMEGVYIKVEDEEQVRGRMKAPREEFEKIRTDDSKWLRRPIFPNLLRSG